MYKCLRQWAVRPSRWAVGSAERLTTGRPQRERHRAWRESLALMYIVYFKAYRNCVHMGNRLGPWVARVVKSDFVAAWEKLPWAGTDPSLNLLATARDHSGPRGPLGSSTRQAIPHHCPHLSPQLQPLGRVLFASYDRLARLFNRLVIYIASLALEGIEAERCDRNFKWPVLKKAHTP